MDTDPLIGSGRASATHRVSSRRRKAASSRLQRFGWRKSFLVNHINDASFTSLLETEREIDVIYMYARAWIQRYGIVIGRDRSFDDDLYAIGLKRRVARSIAAALEPLHDTCYSHEQMLEIAVECALGKYAAITS
jgi:hypothetical protein